MGVRGLTSFIARNAELYLQPYELHDCDLVIDGDSLACNLYKSNPKCNSAFGGDYDLYYRTVMNFFEILFKCNIRPFVLLDGGYEHKKLRTVEKRLRSKIAAIKYINPTSSSPVFPLMLREVFVDAAKDSGGVMIMRCIFEADDELAILARKLNCPVLSYDSDFYIHNVKYIPIVTLTLKVLEKKEGTTKCKDNLSYTRARNLKKRMTTNKSMQGTHWVDNTGASNKKSTIRYLDCCLYTIENLTSNKKIRKDILPIFAALLGNDYVQSSIFRQFFSHIGMKGISTKMTNQQRRIKAILKWLRHETKESAIEKILSRMKKEERNKLLKQIKSATDGYNIEKSLAFEYFGLKEDDYKIDLSEDEDDEDSEVEDESDDEVFTENEEDEGENENKQEEVEQDENNVEEDENNSNSEDDSQEEKPEASEMVQKIDSKNTELPLWFQQRIISGELPRFLVDLFNLRMYINNPQIENFLFEDCNATAIPILTHIYALMTYPESCEFRYLTRVVRVTNVHYKHLSPASTYPFNPFATDMNAFKVIFPPKDFPTQKLFEEIQKLPPNLHLYFLAIVYWTTKTAHADVLHFYSLIICLVVLTTVDERYAEVRDPKLFHKKFGKFIQSFKKVQGNPTTNASSSSTQHENISKVELTVKKAEEMIKNLSPQEKIKFIPKISSALAQERLLKYLNISEDFRKRHNNFSSTILHSFSEFQCIIFFLNTLNELVNKPFEMAKISQFYSGVFLYNLYESLRARTDVEYYIENFIFKDSRIMFEYYKFLIDWCKEFVPFFETTTATAMNKKSKRKTKKKKKDNASGNSVLLDAAADMIDQDDDDDDDGETTVNFNDLNNKFCTLLKVK